MKNITTISGVLTAVDRYDTSRNGNPRYVACVDGKIFFTGVDSSHGYSIDNYEGDIVKVTLKEIRGKTTLQTIEKL